MLGSLSFCDCSRVHVLPAARERAMGAGYLLGCRSSTFCAAVGQRAGRASAVIGDADDGKSGPGMRGLLSADGQTLLLLQPSRLTMLVVVLDRFLGKSAGHPVFWCADLVQRLDLPVVVASFGAGVDA
ncbi:hypothetical protein OG331_47530 [Streptomyces sp. NBC_01017]|uniref:hypothetical protein n=1 Tax=Streptomyces sp. NBC_01017 TaxID=2903721 RepID=UPI00386D315F|nr:hypothetical protein OG331_04450 [Streptomyces sp. NBC_01017]WSV34726.1 hypothetical protein OG331_47530 [Streptomyces sp. NBC_01017]